MSPLPFARTSRSLLTRIVALGCVSASGVVALGAAVSACGESPVVYHPIEGSAPSNQTTGPIPASCTTAAEGCPCTSEGQTADCGDVVHRTAYHVSCSKGTLTCTGGVWGACLGEKWGTRHSLASACATNPCNPTCSEFSDTGVDIDAGADSGVVSNGPTGVTLQGIVGTQSVPCTGLTSTPATVTVTVTSVPASGSITYTASPTPTFTAQFTPANCFSGNAPALWTVDNPTISTVSSAGTFTLVDPVPGPVHVIAHAGSFTAAAPSTVNVVVSAVDATSAPSGITRASFTAATTTADNLTVLYPYNNTVLPLGQLAPVIQWDNGGTAATAVMVQLRYPAGTGAQFTWTGIMPESQTAPTPLLPAKPRAFIPQSAWTAFELAAVGQDADIVIQRIVGTTLRAPNSPIKLHFATDQLKGTVYYQSYGTNLTTNYPGALVTGGGTKNFGAATLAIPAGATTPVLTAGDANNCRVCHSVASSGASLVTQSNTSGDDDSWGYNLLSGVKTFMGSGPTSDGTYSWAALSPDGTYLFSNGGPLSGTGSLAKSVLYTAPGGALVSGVSGLPAIQARTPSFSPDAQHVAYQYYGGSCKAAAVSCAANTDCCSDTCSSCKAGASSCSVATDCCSNNCASCKAAGSSCSAATDCCSDSCQSCKGNGSGPCTVSNQATTCCSGVCGSNGKCSGGSAGNICIGGVAGKQCSGGSAGNMCMGGATGDGKSLASIDYQPSAKVFSHPQTLATPGANLGGTGGQVVGAGTIYYPYYMPDNASLVWQLETVYNSRDPGGTRSQCDGIGCTNNNEGTHAELWWTDVATKKSARLDKLNGLGYLPLHPTYASESSTAPSTADPGFNYEPTVLPQTSGGYAWVVFTSRRRYGNIATINPYWSDPRFQTIDRQPTTKKLWVAAIDLNAPPGTDPSHPAFYLSGQELLAGNSRGYWVLDACKPAGPPTAANLCTDTLDCCDAPAGSPAVTCALDAPPAMTKHCVSACTDACTDVGTTCTTDVQCCGYPTSVCAQGTCKTISSGMTYTTARFSEDYDATTNCTGDTRATWNDTGIKAMLPPSGGTYPTIKVYAQVGNSSADLQPATPALVATMTGAPADQSLAWTNYTIPDAFNNGGVGSSPFPYLRLTFELIPTADTYSAPTLLAWRARFDCPPTF